MLWDHTRPPLRGRHVGRDVKIYNIETEQPTKMVRTADPAGGAGRAPRPLTRETGLLHMGLRVDREKVMFVLHLRSLDEETLVNKIYKEQRSKNRPGLAKETEAV